MIIRETAIEAVVSVNAAFREMLSDHKVFTRDDSAECRWQDGEQVRFGKDTVLEPYTGLFRGNALCSMGAFSYSHSPLYFGLKIGRYCSIAGGLITVAARHPLETLSSSSFFYDRNMSAATNAAADLGYDITRERIPTAHKAAPIIGNDVWIGTDCAINPGVTVQDGSVIARRSTVTKTFAAYALVGGNPAKHIRSRFEDRISERLHQTRWWRLSLGQLNAAPKADPARFLDWYGAEGRYLPDYAPRTLHVWEEVRRLG